MDRIKHVYGFRLDDLGNNIAVDLSDLHSQEKDEMAAVTFKTPMKRIRTVKDETEDNDKSRPYKRQCAGGSATFKNMDKAKVVPAIIKILLTLDFSVDEITGILDSLRERLNTSASKIAHTTSTLDTKTHLLTRVVGDMSNELQNSLNTLSI